MLVTKDIRIPKHMLLSMTNLLLFLFVCFLSFNIALVCSGCHNKVLQTEWLKTDVLSHSSRGQEFKIKGRGGPCALQILQRRIFLHLFLPLVTPGIPYTVAAQFPSLLSSSHGCPPSVSVSLHLPMGVSLFSLKDTSHIRLALTLINYDLILI